MLRGKNSFVEEGVLRGRDEAHARFLAHFVEFSLTQVRAKLWFWFVS